MEDIKACDIEKHIDFDDFVAVFDSGLGGIGTLAELVKNFPNQKFVYFGDSKNAPYGTKNEDDILELSDAIINAFKRAGAKCVIIACNTATSVCVSSKRDFGIEIIGIRPEIQDAIIENANKDIVVFATPTTISGELYKNHIASYVQKKPKLANKIHSMPCPEFVNLVESGRCSYDDVKQVLDGFDWTTVKQPNAVVLGCTHFVFLKNHIYRYMAKKGFDVKFYEGNLKICHRLKNLLSSDANKSDDEVCDLGILENEKEQKNARITSEQLIANKQIIMLNSDSSKLKRMYELFDQYIDQCNDEIDLIDLKDFQNQYKNPKLIKKLIGDVMKFLEEQDLDDLDRELINLKYIKCIKPNINVLSRIYHKNAKYIQNRIVRLDSELF